MKVFISSTYDDLKEYRQAAIDVVLRYECKPLAMEYFGAQPEEPTTVCEKEIRECPARTRAKERRSCSGASDNSGCSFAQPRTAPIMAKSEIKIPKRTTMLIMRPAPSASLDVQSRLLSALQRLALIFFALRSPSLQVESDHVRVR